jgi:hypothetical protein
MATPRKVDKKRYGKAAGRRLERRDDDEALGEELIRTAREQHADVVSGWRQFLKQLGIRAKPISAGELRAMAIREGIDPEGNAFSQGIIAMREE